MTRGKAVQIRKNKIDKEIDFFNKISSLKNQEDIWTEAKISFLCNSKYSVSSPKLDSFIEFLKSHSYTLTKK